MSRESLIAGMTEPMFVALDYLRRAREESPTTDDGCLTNERTFYDGEIGVAFVHWRTADALKRAGLIRYGDHDPEHGTPIFLTAQRPLETEPPVQPRREGRALPEGGERG